jgi:hypothetical protein
MEIPGKLGCSTHFNWGIGSRLSGTEKRTWIGKHRWPERFVERLAEPMHLNLASVAVALFGSYRRKIDFDLIPRRPYAYGVLRAADLARRAGLDAVTVVEFGVAAGNGLLNLCQIAAKVCRLTGTKITVLGLDSGCGLPPPADYRDHPDVYQVGDFPMDQEGLKRLLPPNARLIIGDLRDTIPELAKRLEHSAPLGFASLDVYYYSSATRALRLFSDPDPEKYLHTALLYLDDITFETHNNWCGELMAVNEFNAAQHSRKIEPDRFLRTRRIFKQASWLEQIYVLHVLDHPLMQLSDRRQPPNIYQL